MKKNIRDILEEWPRNFIYDDDLARILGKKTNAARHSLIKRTLKAGILIRIRKGLYLIKSKIKQILPNELELALLIFQPSIVSLESALSYYGWIPEAVYVTTCVTPKRAREFKTPYDLFSYKHVPAQGFYNGVSRIEFRSGGVSLIADPWKALADFIYTTRRTWKNLAELEADLRIDVDTALESDLQLLEDLSKNYPSALVKKTLKNFLKDIHAMISRTQSSPCVDSVSKSLG